MIQIYTQQNCPDCLRAKNFFEQLAIPFECLDITNNTQLKKYVMLELGAYTTPVIVIQQNVIAGFQEKKILDLLDRKKN